MPKKKSLGKTRWIILAALGGIALCGAIALFVVVSVTNGPDLTPLEVAVENAGYHLYKPPRANWGPGFVFSGDVKGGRISNVEEICPNLYSDIGPQEGVPIALPNYTAKDDFTFSLSMRFLKSFAGPELDVGKIERERTVDVKWQNIREMSYTHADQWLPKGEPRPVERLCRSVIDDLKGKGRFQDRVFVIVRSIAPESVTFDFSRTANLEGEAKLTKALRESTKAKGTIENATQLKTNERMYIAYAAPVKIEEWTPKGLVSGEIVEVRGSSASLVIE
jgi:hypothetical protein